MERAEIYNFLGYKYIALVLLESANLIHNSAFLSITHPCPLITNYKSQQLFLILIYSVK